VGVLRRQRPAQLHTRHNDDRRLQRGGAAIMKIRGRERHIPQTGDAEDFVVPLDLGQEKASQVDRLGGVMGAP
jgi:hypothetical protein